MPRQPNVILCICDQLRAFETGCYGHPVVQTPHLDRLAAEGMRFQHAVSNNPVCMPARSCLLSGQYSRSCTGRLNNYADAGTMPEYPVDARPELIDPTLPETFRQAGYHTHLIGKWHVHPSPLQVGFDDALYPRVHHRHTGQHFIHNDAPEALIDGFSVDYEIDAVENFLADPGDDPFFLYYSISPPHMPLADAPERYLNLYSPDDVVLRPNVFKDGQMAFDERWFRIYLWDFLFYEQKLPYTTGPLPADDFDLRHLTALYYGLTTWVDDMVGRLRAALERHDLAEDTVVVFVSDHGDNLGSHHLFNKGQLIEESIRVPLLFWAPDRIRPAVNERQVAQLIDIMPTLLDLCGIDIPASVQGRDLAPLLHGRRGALDQNAAFIETSNGQIGVRTPDQLYGLQLDKDFRTPDGGEVFYDLPTDPYQLNNLAGQRDAGALRQMLLDWHEDTPWQKN